jgi:gas vesicle protein
MDYGRSEERNWQSGGMSSSAIGWLLAGIAISGGVALLLASSTGSELRHAIAGRCRRTFAGISQQTRQLRARGSNLIGFTRHPNQQKSQQS